MTELPAVSVVVPTFHRPVLLRRCLDALLAQSMPADAFEIIVADDGRDDATRDLVRDLGAAHAHRRGPAVRYVRPSPGRGPAAARNAGWRAARAPLVAFTDDDTIPQRQWVGAGRLAMQLHPEWAALSGRLVVPLERRHAKRPTDHELMTLGLEQAEFVTANAFVRRAALERVDGFDERFERAWREDSDLQFRVMRDVGPIGKSWDACVLHPARAERWGVSLRQQRNACFEALLYKKHPVQYRERIEPSRPWRYYLNVSAALVAVGAAAVNAPTAATGAGLVWCAGVAEFTWRRLRRTSRDARHVLEMLVTSVPIPFLSLYWRLRGAVRFRVLFF